MHWNKWIRQTHRWLSVLFTLVVLINGIAVVEGKYNAKLGLAAVFVLALMFLSGAYLFVLPYASKWRTDRRLQ
jgi:heme A synthase